MVAPIMLAACSCAVAAPLADVANALLRVYAGEDGYLGVACEPWAGGIDSRVNCVLAAMNSPAAGWGTQWVDWSGGLPGDLVTIDFGSTATANSMIVWQDSTPGSGDVNESSRLWLDGSAALAEPDRVQPAQTESSSDLIDNSTGVRISEAPESWDITGSSSSGSSTGSILPRVATMLLVPGVLIALGLLGRKHAK
jgi:hypothetical protein